MPHVAAHFCATIAQENSNLKTALERNRIAQSPRCPRPQQAGCKRPHRRTGLADFVWRSYRSLISVSYSFIAAGSPGMRKLIAFDDDTFDKLKQLARDRMATFQELADEAYADLLRKHGIPIDLKDALRKSVRIAGEVAEKRGARKTAQKRKS
jgi:hypothetical protein